MSDDNQSARNEQVSAALKPAYEKAGKLKLTKAEAKALMKPFDEASIEILPSGALYLPHIFISRRLNAVFGPGQWFPMCRHHGFDDQSGCLFAEYVLVIRGCFIGEQFGEVRFDEKKQKYQDVLSQLWAKSLRSICAKILSCGAELWDAAFCERWKAKYAEQYDGEAYDPEFGVLSNGTLWRKKGKSNTVIGAGEAPVGKQTAKKATDDDRFLMLQILTTVGNSNALEYAIKAGILKKGQSLEEWPLEHVPTGEMSLKVLCGKVKEATPAKATGEKDWRKFRVPFGNKAVKNKTLGEIEQAKNGREILADYWATFELTDVTRNNVVHKEFRAALDACGRDLNFQKLKSKK